MKKIIGLFMFLCLAILLTGCNNKYHAKIYGKNANLISAHKMKMAPTIPE